MEMTLDNNAFLDRAALQQSDTVVNKDPFPFFVARNVLPVSCKARLLADFPSMNGAGYLPYEPEKCGKSINELIDQLRAPAFADAMGNTLGIERMSQYPTYVSISEKLNKRHGTIHTDGKSKVATVLLYLNEDWEAKGGCLRFLRKIDDINDTIVPEIPPLFGTLAGFKRCDNSFHGHLPFEGTRRVIQIAWLTSQEDMDRKAKRGKLSHSLKKLLGWLDKKIGQGRKDNASHQ